MRRLIIPLVLILIMLTGCGEKKSFKTAKKGNVKVIKNKNIPTDKSFNYDFTEVAVIPYEVENGGEERNFKRAISVCTDDENNIYIAGSSVARIFKFSPDFNFLGSFGGHGSGPGEFEGGPSSLVFFNDKIYASCWRTSSTNIYNTDGSFIDKLPGKIAAGFAGQNVFNNNMIMNTETREFQKSDVLFKSYISLISPNLDKVEKELYAHNKISDKRVMPLSDMYVRFAPAKDILYIGEVSKDSYKINGFDKNFEKVMEISKSYRSKLVSNPNEYVYEFEPNSRSGGFSNKSKTAWKNNKLYYKSINYMFADKNDRLWVVSPEVNKEDESGLYVDVFEKGIFVNTIYLPFYKSTNFSAIYSPLFIRGDKLFYIDSDDGCVRVYDYKEKKATI